MAAPEGSVPTPPSPDRRVKVRDYTSFKVKVTATGSPSVTLSGPNDSVFYPDNVVVGTGERIVYTPLKKVFYTPEPDNDPYDKLFFNFGGNTLAYQGVAGSIFKTDTARITIPHGDFGFTERLSDWNGTFLPGTRSFQIEPVPLPNWGHRLAITFSGKFNGSDITFAPNPCTPYDVPVEVSGIMRYYPNVVATLPGSVPTGDHLIDITGESYDPVTATTHRHTTQLHLRISESASPPTFSPVDPEDLTTPPYEVIFDILTSPQSLLTEDSWTGSMKVRINNAALVFPGDPNWPANTPEKVEWINAHYLLGVNFCTLNYGANPSPPVDCEADIQYTPLLLVADWSHSIYCNAPVAGWGGSGNNNAVGDFPYAIYLQSTLGAATYNRWYSLITRS